MRIPENFMLYKKGDNENLYYIVESGKIVYTIDENEEILIEGDCFGTKALEKKCLKDCYAKTKKVTYVFSLPIEAYLTSINKLIEKEINDKLQILKSTPLFLSMDKEKISQIAQTMKKVCYNTSDVIVHDEEIPNSLYFIIEGSIDCYKNGTVIKKLNAKDYFCDVQLFCYIESYYNYVPHETVLLYELEYKEIINFLGSNYIYEIVFNMYSNAIRTSDQLNKHVVSEALKSVFSTFELKYYFNDNVYTQKTRKISILLSGELIKRKGNEIVARPGELYGESILDSLETLDSCIGSFDECIVFEAQWSEILRAMKCVSSNNVTLFSRVNLMKNLALFANLSEMKLFKLAEMLKTEHFKSNEVIIKEGPNSDKLYIIKSGKVKVYINNVCIKELEKGSSFGEISSLKSYSRPAIFIAFDKLECYMLDRDSFEEVIDNDMLKPLQKILILKDITIALEHLYYIKELGYGSSGNVYLVHNRKNFFALKSADLEALHKKKSVLHYFLNEKLIMSNIDHPFIVKLVNTFKNQGRIFFLLEFIDGVTLKWYINDKRRDSFRNTYETQFFGAILLNVLSYLQKKRIIHRDMKPDNCMIDKNGYLKIIDFGVAKEMTGKDHTNTVLGTPHYMAPEMLLGKSYNYSIDYWSIGIIMFEVFYGFLPFGQNSSDLMEVYNEITEK